MTVWSGEKGGPHSTANVRTVRSVRKVAFGWYGGKTSHLTELLPLLPRDIHHYCEPFGGSAAILLNREPTGAETYNDLDGEVVNFFKVLRDEFDDLVRVISLTPFSRAEFVKSLHKQPKTDLERARLFYVRARQTRSGLCQVATEGRWACHKDTIRNGMSGGVSKWLGGVPGLASIAERLLRVQLENRPALRVIESYDSSKTFFYVDPPYIHDTRGDKNGYAHEMDNMEHTALAEVLSACTGRVAISGYRSSLADRIYAGFSRRDMPSKMCHSSKSPRQECLWTNY
jgi:DNA adenine methylase